MNNLMICQELLDQLVPVVIVVVDSVVTSSLYVKDYPMIFGGQVLQRRLRLCVLQPRLDAGVVEVRSVLARVSQWYPPRVEVVTRESIVL